MDPETQHVASVRFSNDIAEIDRLTAFIEGFCEQNQVPPQNQFAWTLSLEELVTNIIHYAWPQGGEHQCELTMTRRADAVAACLRDDGIPFDPLARAEPDLNTPLEEREIGGLGIHFVKESMDAVEYRRVDGYNEMHLLKKLPATDAPAD